MALIDSLIITSQLKKPITEKVEGFEGKVEAENNSVNVDEEVVASKIDLLFENCNSVTTESIHNASKVIIIQFNFFRNTFFFKFKQITLSSICL